MAKIGTERPYKRVKLFRRDKLGRLIIDALQRAPISKSSAARHPVPQEMTAGSESQIVSFNGLKC
jgi:hypothetical protein